MKKILFAIIVLYVLIYILPLGVRPLCIPDETRYAEIPREMIATGDFTVPRLNGLLYFEKPVLGYWLNALSIKGLGENAFAVRLPSAVSTGLSAVFVFTAAYFFAGGMAVGLFSAAIFLTFFEVFGIGAFAVLDSMFSMFVTGAMVFFLFAVNSHPESRKRVSFLLSSGFLAGLAFLTKGFIAFVIPVVTIVPFLIWEKKGKQILTLSWIPVAAAVITLLPWAVAVGLKAPDFWNFFIFNEHIRRFAEANAQHAQPFWYFILVFPAAALPWTFLLPAAVSGIRKKGTDNRIIRFTICWFILPFIFFSISRGKLATYILPCFAPLAILFALGLIACFQDNEFKFFSKGALAISIFTTILAVGLVVLQVAGPEHLRPYMISWKWLSVAAAVMLWAFLSFFAARSVKWPKSMALFCAAPLCFMFAAHFAIPQTVLCKKAPGILYADHSERIGPSTVVISESYLAPAVSWFYKKTKVYLFQSVGELSYGLTYPDANYRQLKDILQLKKLVKQHRKKGGTILLVKKDRYEKIKADLPDPVFLDVRGDFVFVEF